MLNDDDLDDEWSHKESLPARIKRDNQSVGKLVYQFESYSVFYPIDKNEFVGPTTRDVATEVKIYLQSPACRFVGRRVTQTVKPQAIARQKSCTIIDWMRLVQSTYENFKDKITPGPLETLQTDSGKFCQS